MTLSELVSVVEVLDPMILSSKVKDVCECNTRDNCVVQIPSCVQSMFDEGLVLSGESRRLYVTLGQFSIIRLERDAQLLIPVLDYSLPTKECCDAPGCAEDPCDMFSRIPFPVARFAPNSCDKAATACNNDCSCYTTTGNC